MIKNVQLEVGRGDQMGDWIDIVAKEADKRFKQGEPLSLAQVPRLLREAGVLYDEDFLQGRTLKKAVEVDGAAQLLVMQDPEKPVSWFVIPKSEASNADPEKLFAPKT